MSEGNKKARVVFVTGGVVSSLGKGLSGSSLAALLQAQGYRVRLRKLDPYLNIDPGTMSPYQHGEVFVTDDGAETDLDLGHYERFTGVSCNSWDSLTTGKIYSDILKKERRGDYLGGTVQVVPHVTNAIKTAVLSDIHDEDFIICEIGGTVGDIEAEPFLEAIRQLANELGRARTLFLHLTWLPYIPAAGELKTKPTQHSVKELQRHGIQPDILLCRSDREVPVSARKKIALFCNIDPESVIPALDVDTIYAVPEAYHDRGLDTQVLKHFDLPTGAVDLSVWGSIVKRIREPEGQVNIAVVGKYIDLHDAYKSIAEALSHGGIENNVKVKIYWLDSTRFQKEDPATLLQDVHAVLIPGGFGERGIEGKIKAIEYVRKNAIPCFGICMGMQVAVIEFARNVLGLEDAHSTEFGSFENSIVGLMTEWNKGDERQTRSADSDLGGTMRLGGYPCDLENESKVAQIYGKSRIVERHRHRYEVNISYRSVLEEGGLSFSGLSPDGKLPEILELKDHPWFIGVQFHPEFLSRPFAPHPLFSSFIEAALKRSRLV